ncbi:MAG: ankyrin repeat domain-containing protein [Rickettsiales bacterium]|nr:ankyrin repeat domain-containing protein [Rickettsiales bacterium]
MNYDQWEKILNAVNDDKDLNKDNVIEKVKEKLEAKDKDEYQKWGEAGFDVNYLFQVEDETLTLLHLAACGNLGSVTSALLGIKGVNVNAVNECKETPLHRAADNGHKDVVEVLLKNKVNINAIDEDRCAPLHRAAGNGHKDVVEVLLRDKANVNAIDEDRCTSLHRAASNGYEDVVEVLLRNKANVDAVDENGWTPLHWAARCGYIEVAKALIENGADPLLKDKDGNIPRDLARDNDIKKPLKDAEKEQLGATTRSFVVNCIIKYCCCSGTFRNRDGCS